ncbi:hypothetical protein PhaeoP23_02749 [Phaeobacter piscinae]|uniref:Uncharacterized protein n=1 Tax=Phaeobacter piscinae TaxID=1580596 RepID=A0ABM6PGE1_9RHOB|nr:hypothetical protein [Phaeobacter piscinae]ATG36853.1 hypothetical protein PhaeoP36_02749 [Phaeobacter piscinae]AUQ87374.1 hypothetical protein PhaeoP42_02750 [Phaeobacter piscinae]AUR25257.1 hypothetical protein PhaeoP23_02749 [Phaeobacter piscinae]
MIVLALVLFLLALTALTPPLIVLLGQFPGPLSVRVESFISEYDGTLISLGTLFLVSGLALLTTHLANTSASKREEYNRRIQAELKLAEFRQTWINDLRDNLADYMSHVGYTRDLQKNVDAEKIGKIAARVELLMNAQDPNLKPLRVAMTHMFRASISKDENSSDAMKELTQVGQDILKTEWDRLKTDLASIKDYEVH